MKTPEQPTAVSVNLNVWKDWLDSRATYSAAMFCVVFLCLAYVISLPLGITYDGHIYIDLADILATHRFPMDWNPSRTPLFPLALKFSFWAFGKQPLSPIIVASAAGLGGILLLGSAVRSLAGNAAGAFSMLVVALDPTLASYEHFVLTETGSFFFLALMIWISGWSPACQRGLWWKTAALVLACTAGYYWRQNLLLLAPWLALLHAIASMRQWFVKAAFRYSQVARAVALQCLLIVLLPNAAARPWSRVSNAAALQDIMLRFGIVKQALAPPSDPFIGPDAVAYRKAIDDSTRGGNFYAGILAQLSNPLADRIFSRYSGGASALFFHLIREYPGRYAVAAMRTTILFAGVKGAQDENEIFREQILSPTWTGAKIGEGPEPLYTRDKDYFAQKTQSSAVQAVLRYSTAIYDPAVVLGSAISVVGVLLSIVFRDFRTFVFTATPIVYLLPYIVTLSSVDRYAFPAHPFFLISAVVVCAVILRRATFRRVPDLPQPKRGRSPMTAQATETATRVLGHCPACGCTAEPQLLYRKWGYPIKRCPDCGLGSTEINGFDVNGIYTSDYFSGAQKDGYADYPGSEATLRREFRSALRSLELSGRSSGRLLEIGCAYGFFLIEARRTFEVSGIEACEEAAKFCRSRGLEVIAGSADAETINSTDTVDVIVMLDVIEHLPDPLDTLRLMNRRLNPGGCVLITTGDWESVLSRVMGSSWRLMTPPQHLFFFSKNTLAKVLARAGFRIIEFSRPTKLVPVSLILFQLARVFGMKPRARSWMQGTALPVNLFDAIRVIAVKERSL